MWEDVSLVTNLEEGGAPERVGGWQCSQQLLIYLLAVQHEENVRNAYNKYQQEHGHQNLRMVRLGLIIHPNCGWLG